MQSYWRYVLIVGIGGCLIVLSFILGYAAHPKGATPAVPPAMPKHVAVDPLPKTRAATPEEPAIAQAAGAQPEATAAQARQTPQPIAPAPNALAFCQAIQPDYRHWQEIKEGMTEAEVEKVLGKPLDPPVRWPGYGYQIIYGRLQFAESECPGGYDFDVLFDKDGRVDGKSDPFGGEFSLDGKPTVPKPLVPDAGATFDYYPRFMDLRWQPSSGEYPITYEVQLTWDEGRDWTKKVSLSTHTVTAPHAVESWGGSNAGYWRVRAKNRLGTSDWSEPRQFEFER